MESVPWIRTDRNENKHYTYLSQSSCKPWWRIYFNGQVEPWIIKALWYHGSAFSMVGDLSVLNEGKGLIALWHAKRMASIPPRAISTILFISDWKDLSTQRRRGQLINLEQRKAIWEEGSVVDATRQTPIMKKGLNTFSDLKMKIIMANL